MPGLGDVNADIGLIDDKGENHWGINTNGTCYPLVNSYMGAYLCDPTIHSPSVPSLVMRARRPSRTP
ncbi:hypothetical protein GQ600_8567 [Phytophthora cactorum]|nr:hypothetical protein GQ600_8567 [Phytophthora cactorum]